MTAGIGSSAFGIFWGGIASAATTGAIAGTVSGIVGGALNGQNVFQSALMGAGYGALSGAVFGGISKFGGKDWNWKVGLARVGMATVAGGGISVLAGGSFEDGAMFAGIVSGADFVYRSIVSTQEQGKNVGASMKTARENGQPKMDAEGNQLTVGNKPIRINDRRYSNVGIASKIGEHGFVNSVAGETGPDMSSLGRYVPGFQGLSLAHDVTGSFFSNTIGGTLNTLTLNFPTMTAIYGLNAAGSLINDSPGMIGFYENFRERE